MSNAFKAQITAYYQKLKGKGNVAILARGAASSFTLKIAGIGLSFVVQVLAARQLGAHSYGIYAYALAWMSMIALIGQMGFDTASVRFITTYQTQQEWGLLKGFLRYSSVIIVIASTLAAICLGLGSWLLRDRLGQELLLSFWLVSLMLPIMTALKVQEQRLIALKKIFSAQFPQTILRNLIILGGLLLLPRLISSIDASTFMLVILLASLISLGMITYTWHREVSQKLKGVQAYFNSEEWWKTGLAMIIVSSLQVILAQSDTIMIGALVGTTETGLYTAAKKIANLLIFPLLAVNPILSPLIVNLYTQKSNQELQKVVSLAANAIFFSTTLIAVAIAIVGKPILGLFGQEFTGSYLLLLILIAAQLINAMAGPVALLLNMTGHHNDTAKIMTLSTVLNIILNAIFIPIYGAVGAALATAIAIITWNIIMAILVWYKLKILAIAIPNFKLLFSQLKS